MKKKEENKNIIEVKEEVQIGDVVLEEGDKIQLLERQYYLNPRAVDMIKDDITIMVDELGHDPFDVGKNIGEVFFMLLYELNQERVFKNFPNGLSKLKNGIRETL